MEKKDRKLGYFARLKKRRQVKQIQSEKAVSEQNSTVISCPDLQNDGQHNRKTDPQRIAPQPPAGSDEGCRSSSRAKREKKRPPGTVELVVGAEDSLNSIALRFNVTPNKLVQLNKLFTRSVYPGQKLFVPDGVQTEAEVKPQESADSASTGGASDGISQNGISKSASTKSLCRQLSPNSDDYSPSTVKFIKMSCKYFTDGLGVVGGVLIVTPNNIMFDPHKSDPLVIERGCEEYGLICPMAEVLSVALYHDVSRMKLKDALPSDLPQDLCPVYRPCEWEQLPAERDLNPFSRYEALDPKRPIVLDDLETGSDEVDKTPSDEGFTEPEPTVNAEENSITLSIVSVDQQEPKQGRSASKDLKGGAILSHTKEDEEEDEGVAQNGSMEDGDSLQSSTEAEKQDDRTVVSREAGDATERRNGRSSPNEVPRGHSHRSERPVEEEEERQKASNVAEMKSWLLERMQAPIKDMLLSSEEKSKQPPMFLCFKVGKPMRKSFTSGPPPSPIHPLGGRGKQPEYWFAVPQERVDHLYSFFVQWSPDVYGKEAREQGFVVVEKDELNMIDNFFSDPTSCSWEIITIDEAKRRQSFSSCDSDLPAEALLPLLSDPSDLLQDAHIQRLACRLPARVQGYPWRLAYSTERNGSSLKTLYRSLVDVDSPALLVVKDMDGQVFGAFSTHPFRVSEHFYGTGETFLYSFCPEIKVYRWSGENSYFVKGSTDSLQMGGEGGHFGLWLDAELYRGTSNRCATFSNQPLSTRQDFNIHSLEVWTFD